MKDRPFFNFKDRTLTAEQRAALTERLLTRDEAEPNGQPKAAPNAPPADLIFYCRKHMQHVSYPRTARAIVEDWYREWRGHPAKPKNVTKKAMAGHIDRVSKWLERHERAGRLRIVDQSGKWNAKRYLQVPGADWRRPRRAKA